MASAYYCSERPSLAVSLKLRYTPTASNPIQPEWRNWQTHQTQNLARFTPRGGSSPPSGTTTPLILSRAQKPPVFKNCPDESVFCQWSTTHFLARDRCGKYGLLYGAGHQILTPDD